MGATGRKRASKPQGAEEPRLTRSRILAETRAMLNEHGMDGVSLRGLAARLGVKAPSLYWHFPDKATLMSALLGELFHSVLDSLPLERDWQAWMQNFGRAIWRVERSSRDFGRLVTTVDQAPGQIQREHERVRAMVGRIDLPEDDAMRLQASIQALVTGWAAFAGAPYSSALRKLMNFDKQVEQDIETLIAGEAARRGEPLRISRKPVRGRGRN